MTYQEILQNPEVNALLEKGNQNLGLLGYTDHSRIHCAQVAHTAARILAAFGYPERDVELARIAGYLHDIGNAINRTHHAAGQPDFTRHRPLHPGQGHHHFCHLQPR